jgi:hypothetical protein
VQGTFLEFFPFTALDLAAAGEGQGVLQPFPLACASGFTVVKDTRINRPEKDLVRGRIENPTRDRSAVLYVSDRGAEFWNAFYELAGTIQWIHNPDPRFVETGKIVDALFRQPALAIAQQILPQDSIDRSVGFSNRIVPGLEFGVDGARGKSAENVAGRG